MNAITVTNDSMTMDADEIALRDTRMKQVREVCLHLRLTDETVRRLAEWAVPDEQLQSSPWMTIEQARQVPVGIVEEFRDVELGEMTEEVRRSLRSIGIALEQPVARQVTRRIRRKLFEQGKIPIAGWVALEFLSENEIVFDVNVFLASSDRERT